MKKMHLKCLRNAGGQYFMVYPGYRGRPERNHKYNVLAGYGPTPAAAYSEFARLNQKTPCLLPSNGYRPTRHG